VTSVSMFANFSKKSLHIIVQIIT